MLDFNFIREVKLALAIITVVFFVANAKANWLVLDFNSSKRLCKLPVC